MLTLVGRIALPALAAGLLALPAHAEIYTWIDASGVTNVTNLPPPEGAKVTKVQPALPPDIVAREDAARETARKAEAEALAKRVRELEDVLSRSPPPDYRPPAAPPAVQYIVEPQPAPMQLTVETAPPAYDSSYGYGGCNPSWAGCALSWWPGLYPASVIVVNTPRARPTRPTHGGPNAMNPRLPPPFGPQLTNAVSPVTNIVAPLTRIAAPVTNVVAPIPQTFSGPRSFNSPPGLRHG